MKFSARTTYLLIACIIALLFTGTGAYYVLDLQNKKNQEKEPETYLADTPWNSSESTPAPTSTPIPTLIPSPTPDTIEKNLNKDSEDSEVLLSDQIEETLNSSCYKTCEYSYECSGDLQCLPIDGINKCVNQKCESNSNCNCDLGSVGMGEDIKQVSQAIKPIEPEETPVDTNSNTISESLGGIDDEEVETEEIVVEETYESDLPKAGSQEFTLAILAIGIAITAIGVVWNKSQV